MTPLAVSDERRPDSRPPHSKQLPPPGRVALFFFGTAGEEQVTEDGDEAGSEIELVSPVVLEHALRDHAHRRDKQSCGRCKTQPVFAKHETTLDLLEHRFLLSRPSAHA